MNAQATKTKFRRRGWVAALLASLLAMLGASAHAEIVYYHNDLAGSPVVATNEAGTVIWRESYRPYGERLTNASAATGNKVWFTSRHQEATTGLVYMGARYYDPVVGRFVSTDPVGFDEKTLHSHNRYAYANNNPLRYVDLDGRVPQAITVVGGVLLVGSGVYLTGGPEQRARIEKSISELGKKIGETVSDALGDGLIFAKPPHDAHDPQGAKAPGKPGENEGFKDPKGGEDWVRNPNGRGRGWLADDGKVWVPTGPGGAAHGGPHWDVQNPRGGHENVYPGGATR